ncbi:hypothetical protein OIE73_13795 [Streptomyces hirsutus]|uniref:Uncharacterized protein n=2 Tax=Streptomyces hirsutus TaxID=35620 RepID=A0ABZ1GNN4_9ACTN|nr:hypothetical protein [Streptomyces hirsutus]WSD06739.1 hypothetical protein OIE73_13795 [Streptomyces hirsutus]
MRSAVGAPLRAPLAADRNRSLPAGVVVFMEQGGSTMGEEPAGLDLLLGLLLMAAIPTVVGGAVILSLVGLTVWATAPLRRRGRAKAERGRAPSGGARDH